MAIVAVADPQIKEPAGNELAKVDFETIPRSSRATRVNDKQQIKSHDDLILDMNTRIKLTSVMSTFGP
jgi:hypothetical protein